MLWISEFIKSQGYLNVVPDLKQDNQSTIALINKGRSSAESTRHINIRFFFVHDKVINGEIKLTYLETENMLTDIFTKPLTGKQFFHLRNIIFGTPSLK